MKFKKYKSEKILIGIGIIFVLIGLIIMYFNLNNIFIKDWLFMLVGIIIIASAAFSIRLINKSLLL